MIRNDTRRAHYVLEELKFRLAIGSACIAVGVNDVEDRLVTK